MLRKGCWHRDDFSTGYSGVWIARIAQHCACRSGKRATWRRLCARRSYSLRWTEADVRRAAAKKVAKANAPPRICPREIPRVSYTIVPRQTAIATDIARPNKKIQTVFPSRITPTVNYATGESKFSFDQWPPYSNRAAFRSLRESFDLPDAIRARFQLAGK
jgi:hypothetical protein